MNPWLPKRLETVDNAVEIAQLIIKLGDCDLRERLLPTILEYMYGTVQVLLEENCIVDLDYSDDG